MAPVDAGRPERARRVAFAANDDVARRRAQCDSADAHRAAAWVYDRLIGFARAEGYPHVLRVWNHVARHQRARDGRSAIAPSAPGGTKPSREHGYAMLRAAICRRRARCGMRAGGVASYFIASRAPAESAENPRQVSAYDYPPRYGPRSPSFSRATRGAGLVFVSGTASVVGHETKHAGDVSGRPRRPCGTSDVCSRRPERRSAIW